VAFTQLRGIPRYFPAGVYISVWRCINVAVEVRSYSAICPLSEQKGHSGGFKFQADPAELAVARLQDPSVSLLGPLLLSSLLLC
jgi:hypothetical protein